MAESMPGEASGSMVTATASGALWNKSRIYPTGHAARPLSGSVWQQAAAGPELRHALAGM